MGWVRSVKFGCVIAYGPKQDDAFQCDSMRDTDKALEAYRKIAAERDRLAAENAELKSSRPAETAYLDLSNKQLVIDYEQALAEIAELKKRYLHVSELNHNQVSMVRADTDERDRLATENADLRKHLNEANDLAVRLGNDNAELRKAYEQQYEAMNALVQELKRRDATLDKLRELFMRLGKRNEMSEVIDEMDAILYPKPTETTDV